MLAAECHDAVDADAEALREGSEVQPNQAGVEAVEARRHRRMGREQVSRAGRGERHVEWLTMVLHEPTGALEDGQCRVPLIEMAHLGIETECTQQPPPADAEQDFLLQAQLRATAVQLAGYPAYRRWIGWVVTVKEIEGGTPDTRLPGARPEPISR